MDLPLFQIRNLTCSYNKGAGKSLSVEQLDIPKGKLVFLLGASGAGKSTLLETLGLMNNTINSGEVLFYTKMDTLPIDFNELWQGKKKQKITAIRKKYFSFIFQNTNLMENFTAYENVCLSGMIKQGLSQEEILPEAKILMDIVKLPENEVSLSTLAGNLSGGQRQRLSFVRALNTSANVLFCDEPTGNLDEVNANELFEVIKSYIQGEKSAIVVSHDIDLAIKHAGMIIVISKDTGKGYGEIVRENIYQRSQWEKNNEEQNKTFVHKIRSLFLTGKDQLTSKTENSFNINIKSSYRSLFYKKEGQVLAGKKRSNLIVLTTILFFTFLSIGFANGSLDYLNKIMNNAFVQWVNFSIPWAKDKESIHNLMKLLNQPENKAKYQYQNPSTYLLNSFMFRNYKSKEASNYTGRSVDFENDARMLSELLDKKNFIRGNKQGFRSENDISIIVTERMLLDLDYPADADFILWENDVTDTLLPIEKQKQKVYLPLPIRAIVKTLPGKYSFVFTTYFFKSYLHDDGKVFSSISDTRYLFGFIRNKGKEDIKKIKSDIDEFSNFYKWPSFIADSLKPKIVPTIKIETIAINGGLRFEIEFYPNLVHHGLMDTFWVKLMKSPRFLNLQKNTNRIFDYGMASTGNSDPTYDQISIYFDELDHVREFSDYIFSQNKKGDKEANNIEIDETKIRDKENFNFLSKVTGIISILLIIFSTVAISLFIFNLLKMHLLKVKMNLGTFKAIGLEDRETRNIYFFIILSFIFLSSIIALLLAAFAGELLNIYLVKNFKVEEGIRYFKIMDWVTFATLFVIIITSILVSWFTINRIISKSPGDLIYNR